MIYGKKMIFKNIIFFRNKQISHQRNNYCEYNPICAKLFETDINFYSLLIKGF